MGIVAPGAVSRPHGSVQELGFSQDRLHVSYYAPVFSGNGAVVAFETDFVHSVAKQLRPLRSVRGVAVGALTLLENRPMRYTNLCDTLLDLLVTGQAHLVHWHF